MRLNVYILLMLIDLGYLSLIMFLAIIGQIVGTTETIGIGLLFLGLATTETVLGLLIIRIYLESKQMISLYDINRLRM